MKTEIAQLVADLRQSLDSGEVRFDQLIRTSEEARLFCEACYEDPRVFKRFDHALERLNETDFAAFIAQVMQSSSVHADTRASILIAASEQFPHLLHSYLVVIDEQQFIDGYMNIAPWRYLPKSQAQPFIDQLLAGEDTPSLIDRLTQTRDKDIFRLVYDYVKSTPYLSLFDHALGEVGYYRQEDSFYSFCPNTLYHICFPDAYLCTRGKSMTWDMSGRGEYRFGGTLASSTAHNPFVHLITLAPIPSGIIIQSVEKLTLALHIRELCECVHLYYEHDTQGQPIVDNRMFLDYDESTGDVYKLTKDAEMTLDVDFYPIVETKASLALTPSRWHFQDWGYADKTNLSRIGGEPSWIQGGGDYKCAKCEKPMDFLMQLDSVLPDTSGEDVLWGSGGLLYVFWCDTCRMSGYFFQCT